MDKRPNLDGIESNIQNYIFQLEKRLKAKNIQLSQLNSKINDLTNSIQKLTVENDKYHLLLANSTNRKTNEEPKKNIDLTEEIEDESNNVIIKGLNINAGASNLEKIVLTIASEMKLKITEKDIAHVRVLERGCYQRSNMEPNITIVVVQFRTNDVKVNFLKNKRKLQNNKIAKNIQIQDFVSENTYNLYKYTKSLKLLGYASVYWRNNSVFVKKTDFSDSEEIEIHDTSEADALIEPLDKSNIT